MEEQVLMRCPASMDPRCSPRLEGIVHMLPSRRLSNPNRETSDVWCLLLTCFESGMMPLDPYTVVQLYLGLGLGKRSFRYSSSL